MFQVWILELDSPSYALVLGDSNALTVGLAGDAGSPWRGRVPVRGAVPSKADVVLGKGRDPRREGRALETSSSWQKQQTVGGGGEETGHVIEQTYLGIYLP